MTKKIFTDLSEWQVAQLARHPLRPKSQEIINAIVNDFQELHGDRMYSDDASIIGGLGKLGNISVMFIAQKKERIPKIKCSETLVCLGLKVIEKLCD